MPFYNADHDFTGLRDTRIKFFLVGGATIDARRVKDFTGELLAVQLEDETPRIYRPIGCVALQPQPWMKVSWYRTSSASSSRVRQPTMKCRRPTQAPPLRRRPDRVSHPYARPRPADDLLGCRGRRSSPSPVLAPRSPRLPQPDDFGRPCRRSRPVLPGLGVDFEGTLLHFNHFERVALGGGNGCLIPYQRDQPVTGIVEVVLIWDKSISAVEIPKAFRYHSGTARYFVSEVEFARESYPFLVAGGGPTGRSQP